MNVVHFFLIRLCAARFPVPSPSPCSLSTFSNFDPYSRKFEKKCSQAAERRAEDNNDEFEAQIGANKSRGGSRSGVQLKLKMAREVNTSSKNLDPGFGATNANAVTSVFI